MGYRDRAAQLMHMLIPINKSRNVLEAERYHVEPYAVAADIYGEGSLTGMGGWTWYTGSAGWMYRVLVESILGFEIKQGNVLSINPLILPGWKQYQITVKSITDTTVYNISVENPSGLAEGDWEVSVDDEPLSAEKDTVTFEMKNDGKVHQATIKIR